MSGCNAVLEESELQEGAILPLRGRQAGLGEGRPPGGEWTPPRVKVQPATSRWPRRIKRRRAVARKAYRSEKITVSFDLQRCIHARECVRGLPEVFDTEKRPWIQPDNTEPDTITTVVLRCPSGALQFLSH